MKTLEELKEEYIKREQERKKQEEIEYYLNEIAEYQRLNQIFG